MALLHYLSYGAVIVAFAFVTLSLASGLLYISELIEEHSRLAKTLGQRAIYMIILLHIALYFSESLPFKHILFSIACHIIYLQNFSAQWPLISLTSLSFIASCIFVISDHFLWFFYFAHVTQEARHSAHRAYGIKQTTTRAPSFMEISTFFGVCVWLAPLFLFLSLSANDNALPIQTDTVSSTATRVSLFRSLLKPRTSRREQEGILAPPPRSPGPSSPILPRRSTSFDIPRDVYSTPPPLAAPPLSRSPRLGPYAGVNGATSAFAATLSPPSQFSLETPPLQQQRIALRRTGSEVAI